MALRPKLALFATGLASLALIAGCGDDDETTTAAETDAPAPTATTAPTTTVPEPPGPGVKPPPEPEPQELTQFSTPSGNIGCVMDAEYVRCDIQDRDWEPPPAPADCDVDFGQGVSVSDEQKAQFVCAGDTTLGGEDVLEYGESSRVGPYRCVSAAAGITCQADSGHGFFLSKETYELF